MEKLLLQVRCHETVYVLKSARIAQFSWDKTSLFSYLEDSSSEVDLNTVY